MSKLGWLTRIGGYAASPFTFGLSIPAGQVAASAIEKKQASNDAPKGSAPGSKHPEDPYTAILQKQAETAGQTGQQYSQMGSEALAPAMEYLKNILSSDPSAVLEATRADRGRVIDQYDAARKAVEQFGPRGGGTTSALAQSRFSQAESLADITSNARQNAVATDAQLGPQLMSLGLNAQSLASSDIDSIIRSVMAREGLNVQQRGQNMQMVGDIAETIGTLIGIWLGREGGGRDGSNQPAGVSGGTIGNTPIYR